MSFSISREGTTEPTTTAEDLAGLEGEWGYIDGSGLVAQGDDALNTAAEAGGIIVAVQGTYAASGNPQTAVLQLFGECYAIAAEAINVGEYVTNETSAGNSRTVGADGSTDIPRGRALDAAAADGDKIRVYLIGAVDEAIA